MTMAIPGLFSYLFCDYLYFIVLCFTDEVGDPTRNINESNCKKKKKKIYDKAAKALLDLCCMLFHNLT